MGEFLGKRVIPRHEGDWEKARSYEPLMIVLDPETGDGYISRYDVPAGTLLTNEHYWARCSISMLRCTVWKQMWQKMWKECTQILLIRSLR